MVDCSFSRETLPWWGLMAGAGAALAGGQPSSDQHLTFDGTRMGEVGMGRRQPRRRPAIRSKVGKRYSFKVRSRKAMQFPSAPKALQKGFDHETVAPGEKKWEGGWYMGRKKNPTRPRGRATPPHPRSKTNPTPGLGVVPVVSKCMGQMAKNLGIPHPPRSEGPPEGKKYRTLSSK